jgi:hypothetical protein
VNAQRIPLSIAEALKVLGMLPSSAVPGIAADALEDGLDSYALRILAGLDQSEAVSDAPQWFDRALGELGWPPLSFADALLRYARWMCWQILRNTIEPYEGAKLIWRAMLQSRTTNIIELHPFVYAASEWESRPDDRRFFEEAICAAAAHFLERHQEE